MIKIAGLLLILLGIVSAVVLFLHPFGVAIKGSVIEFWLLYALCFVGGFVLYGMGTPDASSGSVLKVASSLVLGIGLLSALALILDKLSIVSASGTISLWLLFILSTLAGVVGLVTAEGMRSKELRE